MLCSGAAGQSCAAAAGAEPPSGKPPPAGGESHQEVRCLDAVPGFVTIVTPLAFTEQSALCHMTRSGSW